MNDMKTKRNEGMRKENTQKGRGYSDMKNACEIQKTGESPKIFEPDTKAHALSN